MTCPLGQACEAPKCRGVYGWKAKGPPSGAEYAAFVKDIVAYMKLTGEKSIPKASQAVFRAAMKDQTPCR